MDLFDPYLIAQSATDITCSKILTGLQSFWLVQDFFFFCQLDLTEKLK